LDASPRLPDLGNAHPATKAYGRPRKFGERTRTLGGASRPLSSGSQPPVAGEKKKKSLAVLGGWASHARNVRGGGVTVTLSGDYCSWPMGGARGARHASRPRLAGGELTGPHRTLTISTGVCHGQGGRETETCHLPGERGRRASRGERVGGSAAAEHEKRSFSLADDSLPRVGARLEKGRLPQSGRKFVETARGKLVGRLTRGRTVATGWSDGTVRVPCEDNMLGLIIGGPLSSRPLLLHHSVERIGEGR
jgi:hypothetical protein